MPSLGRAASVRANIGRTNERMEALKADDGIITQGWFWSGAGGAMARKMTLREGQS